MQPSATYDRNLRASRVSLSAYSMGSLEEGSKFLWVSLVSSTAVSLSGAVSILQPGLSASSLTHTPARLTECDSARIKLSQLRHHSRADLGEDFAKSFGKRSCSKSCWQLLLFQYEIDVPLKCLAVAATRQLQLPTCARPGCPMNFTDTSMASPDGGLLTPVCLSIGRWCCSLLTRDCTKSPATALLMH